MPPLDIILCPSLLQPISHIATGVLFQKHGMGEDISQMTLQKKSKLRILKHCAYSLDLWKPLCPEASNHL